MTPEQIQKALKKHGITQKVIAARIGVADMSVSRIVNKRPGSTSDRIMAAVAQAIGLPKERVFPEYYLGPRRRRTSKAMGPASYTTQ